VIWRNQDLRLPHEHLAHSFPRHHHPRLHRVGRHCGDFSPGQAHHRQTTGFSFAGKTGRGGGQTGTGSSVEWREQQADFYGTIIETLESAEMNRRALERVRALNPDLKESDVDIRVTQSKGSTMFNILANGTEPKYTRIFLDALLDEFIAFRTAIREQSQGKVIVLFLQEMGARKNKMEKSLQELEKVRSRVESLSAKSDQERLLSRLNSLRNQRDDFLFELKSKAENDPDRAPLQTNLRTIEIRIQVLEAELQRLEPGFSELRVLTEKYATEKGAYEKMFEMAERWESAFKSTPDNIAIQERATPAYEHVEDWRLPITIGAVGGGFLGAALGFLLSLILVRPASPSLPPTA